MPADPGQPVGGAELDPVGPGPEQGEGVLGDIGGIAGDGKPVKGGVVDDGRRPGRVVGGEALGQRGAHGRA